MLSFAQSVPLATRSPLIGTITYPVPLNNRPSHVQTSKMTLSPVIIGGGPAGSLLAASLSHRNIPCTVLEKAEDFLPFDTTRAYSMSVDFRGSAALASVPGLLPVVAKEAHASKTAVVTPLLTNGKTMTINRSPFRKDIGYRFVRAGISVGLRNFISSTPANVLYGATVTDVQFMPDGVMHVSYKHQGVVKSVSTKFLLACDGTRSVVADAINHAHASNFTTKRGLGVSKYDTPSVGLCVKSLSLDPDSIKSLLPDLHEDIDHIRALIGNGGSANFSIALFPTPDSYISHCGGMLGTVVRPENHPVWQLKTVEEAYDMFQRNFPQIDARKVISEATMTAFVNGRPARFPQVQRRDSLVVHVGENQEGGIVFLGDAAHSAPPDIGQGVNSAFQDVHTLSQVMEQIPNAPIAQILDEYESRRDHEIDSLVTLQRFASPYQYGQSRFRGALHTFIRKIRRALAKLSNGSLHPSYADMISTKLPYSEIVRRSDTTVKRIVLAVVGTIAFVTLVARFM